MTLLVRDQQYAVGTAGRAACLPVQWAVPVLPRRVDFKVSTVRYHPLFKLRQFLDDTVRDGRYTEQSGINKFVKRKRRYAVFPLMDKERGLREGCATLVCILAAMIFCTGVDALDPDRAKSVLLGTPFEITVKANPSTGFEWTVDYDRQYLSLKSRTYTRDPSKPKDWVGVGGDATFVFVPIKTGQTRIRLVYKRKWEPAASKEVVYSVTIGSR